MIGDEGVVQCCPCRNCEIANTCSWVPPIVGLLWVILTGLLGCGLVLLGDCCL